MNKKENMIRMNPQFIRLNDGSLMNINNIVAISEADSKVFVLGYQRIPITEEDMTAVLGNIEIIDDDEYQHHCGKDADMDDACCQAAYDPNESQPVDTAPMSLHELTGMQVVGAYPKGWKCKDCIFSKMKNSRCEKKVELVGGYFLCLANIQPNEGAF